MNCLETSERLETFHDGELIGREMREVALHVAQCAACAVLLAEWEKLHGLIHKALEPKADAVAAIWEGVESEIEAPRETDNGWGGFRIAAATTPLRIFRGGSAVADKPEAELDQLIAILMDWIDQDRKATPLKSLQGQIWKAGYENGDFRGHIYPDAHAGLTRWHAQGAHMSVYSSGSIAAQQLLFGHSDFGDMRPLFQAWFDTTTGPKRDTQSYSKIAQALDFRLDHILFLSDVSAELDAAREAGLQTIHLVRDDSIMPTDHEAVTSFDAIHLEIAQ